MHGIWINRKMEEIMVKEIDSIYSLNELPIKIELGDE